MAQGQERRVALETNESRSLRSMGEIKPVAIPQTAGPAASPRLPAVQVTSNTTDRIAQALGQYGSGLFDEAARVRQKRSLLDGQMAAQQGKSFEELEMGGDKWALEGYRLVEAQRMASSLLTAQQQEISQGLYEMDPDQYRAHFMNRAEGVLKNATDPRTSELAREQLLKQMPVLVDSHLTNHMQWKENKNFDALSQSIDTISSDPTASDTLVAFARGEPGSPTAGLSEDRRREAVTSGIVRAFENDNPAAYAVLANTGMLKEMPVAQQRSIRAAKQAFENRRRNEYDAEFITAENELMDRVSTGELQPQQAMDLYADLLAQHNITITAQEAGEVYSAAQQGVRTKKVTNALLVQEAMMRGDRDTAVNVITNSLIGTESSGDPRAVYRDSKGRTFGGHVQMGDDRLADYNKVHGTSHTAETFKMLSPQEQRQVSNWHFNDILDQIEAKGYDKLVGKAINGVEVTIPGLVAVAHLGGKGGLDQFIATKGQHNPADELGTSLTDYLRKHGTGATLTGAQQRALAQQSIARVRELAAIDVYEQTQPMLDEADRVYKETGDEQAWRETRQAIYDEFSIERTMRQAQHELGMVEQVRKQAEDVLDEDRKVQAHARTKLEEAKLEQVLEDFEQGKASQQDVVAAQQALNTALGEIRAEFGLPNTADVRTSQLDAQAARISKAVDRNRQFTEEQALIDRAVISGTLDELDQSLQDRAVKQQRARVTADIQDAMASGNVSHEQAEDLFSASMADFYAQTNMVDRGMERTLNGFLSGPLLDKDGKPNAAYVQAATQYRTLMDRNPTLADKYIRPENRAELDAVIDAAAGGPIEGAVRTIGTRKLAAPRLPTKQEFINDPDNLERVERAVADYLDREEIGLQQAIWTGTADMQQVWNRSWFDRFGIQDEENRGLVQNKVQRELLKQFSRNPTLRPSELVAASSRRVQERTPLIGGIAVDLPMDGPSAGEMFFGARAADFTDQANVINDAIMDFFRTDEFREQFPFAEQTSFQEGLPVWVPESVSLLGLEIPLRGEAGTPSDQAQTLWTGVRPFQTFYTGGQWQVIFSLPSGGYSDAITLNPRQIGQEYIKRHTAKAAQ